MTDDSFTLLLNNESYKNNDGEEEGECNPLKVKN